MTKKEATLKTGYYGDIAVLGDQYGLFRRKDTREEKGGI